MVREVDLVSYLPPFLAEYEQTKATLEAENPEFVIMWNAADRVLRNEFIATADEYGILRFERILKIYPSKKDTLESRRARVQARWFRFLPYTEKMLLKRLISLCGENNFIFTKKYEQYRIEIEVSLELFGQVEELENLINEMVSCNMVVAIKNKIIIAHQSSMIIAGGASAVETFLITNDFNERIHVERMNSVRSGVVVEEHIKVSDAE